MGTTMLRKLTLATMLVASTQVNAELKPGSVAIYSDGSVEKLVRIEDGWRLWESERKRLYSRSDLPVVPVLHYQKFPDRSQGYRQRVINGQPQLLLPFGAEESMGFDVQRISSSTGNTVRRWDCKYVGKGSFTLRKTKLKTEKYECSRFAVKATKTDELKETVRLKYSPKLGLVVDRRSTSAKGKKERVKLVRVLKPGKVTAKRIARTVYKLRASD